MKTGTQGCKNVCVVIPKYRERMSEYEKVSLNQCSNVLHKHRKVFVSPYELNNEDAMEEYCIDETVYFNGRYFRGTAGYNRLMLSGVFYEKFSEYDYILIHQLDALVFRDELIFWCDMDYDYIGAPWLKAKWPYSSRMDEYLIRWKNGYWPRFIRKMIYPKRRVGNGGFSLRKVTKFMEVLEKLHPVADEFPFHEDLFWSIVVPDHFPSAFRKPSVKRAARFSVETSPRLASRITNSDLPFGCHAWEKHDLEYWRDIFAGMGIKI